MGAARWQGTGQPYAGGHGPQQVLLHLLVDWRERLLDALVEGALSGRGERDGAEDGAEVEQLRASMGEVFDMFVACATAGRDLQADELALFERIGAARCSDGLALESVVEEFRAAFDRCYQRLVDLVGHPPEPQRVAALKELTPIVYRLRDAALEALGRGHAARRQQVASGSAAGAVALLRALLDDDARRLVAERRRHGLAGDRPATLLIVTGEMPAHDGRRFARLLDTVPGALAAQFQPGHSSHAVILATVDGHQVPSLEPLRATVGEQAAVFALPPGSLEEIVASYWWLAPRLRLCRVLADEDGYVSRSQLHRYRLLADVSDAEAYRYVARTIGPLLAQPAAETAHWRATLTELCHTDRVATAAQRLGCVRTTVDRHTSRILALTGLDPRDPEDRKDLALALVLLETHRQALPPVGDRSWSRPVPY